MEPVFGEASFIGADSSNAGVIFGKAEINIFYLNFYYSKKVNRLFFNFYTCVSSPNAK